MIRNDRLFGNAYTLYQKTKSIIKPEVTDFNSFRPVVIELDEYKEFLEELKKDQKISSFINKTVYPMGKQIFDYVDIIFDFINEIINKKLNKVDFKNFYILFEDFFYSDYFEMIDKARLYNFKLEQECIQIYKSLCIKNTPDFLKDIHIMNDHNMDVLYPFPLNEIYFSTVLERKYKLKKMIVGNDKAIKSINLERDKELFAENHISEVAFKNVVKCLRIMRKSGVFLGNDIFSFFVSFYEDFHKISSPEPNLLFDEIFNFSSVDFEKLQDIYKNLEKIKENNFNIAVDHFNSGISNHNLINKLIDFIIGLEALFLKDINQELQYKLAIRIAFSLKESNSERKEIFNLVLKSYGIRSNILHGGKNLIPTSEDLISLEEILRKSINLYLKDKNKFNTNTLKYITFIE